MNKNKMLSVAAAAILTTTGAFAFESDINGNVYTTDAAFTTGTPTYKMSHYTQGADGTAAAALNLSANKYGDALIFPKFTSEDNWETEISFKNSSATDGVVAKVVLYSATDSRELRDFNVYLSAKDSFTFKIAGNDITTRDGSFIKSSADLRTTNDGNTTDADVTQVTTVAHEAEGDYSILYTDAYKLKDNEKVGYVVVYGMAQSHGLSYHKAHAPMFNDYRQLLDTCRPTWAAAMANGEMFMGSMVDSNITAPNVDATCNNGSADANVSTFGDVASDALTGTVRLSQTNGTDSRDMILPATAIDNFTDSTMLLWSEGEYASLADRRLANVGTLPAPADNYVEYDNASINADAATFQKSTVLYTYHEKALTNKLVITQPYKRVLVQLGDTAGQYSSHAVDDMNRTTSYGAFVTSSRTYNEDEGSYTPVGGQGPIISPATTNPEDPDSYSNEVQVITDLEKIGIAADDSTNAHGGFTDITIANGMPAIVTQMVGSVEVDGDAQVNWIYAPSKLVTP